MKTNLSHYANTARHVLIGQEDLGSQWMSVGELSKHLGLSWYLTKKLVGRLDEELHLRYPTNYWGRIKRFAISCNGYDYYMRNTNNRNIARKHLEVIHHG